MRFKWIDKLLLVLVLLLVIALAALCIGIAMSFITLDTITNVAGIITNGMIANQLIMAGIGLVLLIFAFRLFIAMGRRKESGTASAPKPSAVLVLTEDHGAAYISIPAIDAMVQRHCRANPKVKECESNITVAEEKSISIQLRLVVSNETVLPEFMKTLQDSLKEYVESYGGINVRSVDILIVIAPAQPKQQTPRVV